VHEPWSVGALPQRTVLLVHCRNLFFEKHGFSAVEGAAGDAEGVESGLEAVLLEEVEDFEAFSDVLGECIPRMTQGGRPVNPP
jgi:hypothetical protein